jgi:hypothetical protein
MSVSFQAWPEQMKRRQLHTTIGHATCLLKNVLMVTEGSLISLILNLLFNYYKFKFFQAHLRLI